MISITRGDTQILKFQRRNKDGIITTKANEMYFTIKENTNQKKYLLQKKLDDGISFNNEDYYYRITINSTDTDDLSYGKYKYDIEVKDTNYVKTISIGDFIITEEVTFVGNEVE